MMLVSVLHLVYSLVMLIWVVLLKCLFVRKQVTDEDVEELQVITIFIGTVFAILNVCNIIIQLAMISVPK